MIIHYILNIFLLIILICSILMLLYINLFIKENKDGIKILNIIILIFFAFVGLINLAYNQLIFEPNLRHHFIEELKKSQTIIVKSNNEIYYIKNDSLQNFKHELKHIKNQGNHKNPTNEKIIKLIFVYNEQSEKTYIVKLDSIWAWNSIWVYSPDKNEFFIGIIDTYILNEYFRN